jgi:phosphoserine phosphatase RsbU/P
VTTTSPVSGAQILIVDDSEDSADITSAYLRDGGFREITVAHSAAEAYNVLGIEGRADEGARSQHFDLLVMDILMPEIDGIEACARIRMHTSYRLLPILILSAAEDVELLNQAFIAGANDFTNKPVNQIDLLARVRTLLRLKREQDRRQAREAELKFQQREFNDALDSVMDPLTDLASTKVIDLILGRCTVQEQPAALALIQIDDYVAFVRQNGDTAAERLMRAVAKVISVAPGPLSAAPVRYDEGSFMIVQPRTEETGALAEVCHLIRRRVAEMRIEHGNSIHGDIVTVSTAVSGGRPKTLSSLPARLIAGFERHWSQSDSHIDVS